MERDGNILSRLEEILVGANQEIPEWFAQRKNGGGFGGGKNYNNKQLN
jgi:hypothetical protein